VVVKALFADFASKRVDDPAVKRDGPGSGQLTDVISSLVAAQVHDDLVLVVVGVEGVKDPAAFNLEPAHR
jgi:hypothetical protein